MRERRSIALVYAFALAPLHVAAQELPGVGTGTVDSVVVQAADAPARRWALDAEAWVRFDRVEDLPAGRDDLQRLRSQLDLGLTVHPSRTLELAVGVEGALGTDDNDDNRLNNDNEASDDLNLDHAVGTWRPTPDIALQVGQDGLPWTVSPLLWDAHLNPAGAALTVRLPARDFDRFRLAAGWFGVRSLAESWVRLAAAQAGWSWRDGGPRGADLRAGLLHFDHEDALVADQLARTNRVANGRFVSDFDLLDLLAGGRWEVAGFPAHVQAEWVENLGAEDESSGWRIALQAGNADLWHGLAVHYAYHQLERDAVLAAFDSDDWWFHSWFRGHRAGVQVNPWRDVRVGISGSIERREDLSTWTRRLLIDVHVGGGVAR
jgi:hypothetical protein